MEKKEHLRKFLNKESQFAKRLEKDYLKDGTAYIPCHVDGIHDIISKYSRKGYERLDLGFADYVLDRIELVPADHPIVLKFSGHSFSEEEKETIRETIAADGDYLFGMKIAENRRRRRVFWWMLVGTIISAIVITLIGQFLDKMPSEFMCVIFWLFADSFVRYLFLERGGYKEEQILAGRVASINVEF